MIIRILLKKIDGKFIIPSKSISLTKIADIIESDKIVIKYLHGKISKILVFKLKLILNN